MKRDETQGIGSFSGLAKRWLKTQLSVHGDPIKAARDRREAEAIEYEARERAEYEVGRTLVNTLMPTSWRERIETLEAQSELAKQQRAEQLRAEHLARPRAQTTLQFSGDINGHLVAEVPVDVSWPDEGSWVVISLETLEPLAFGPHLFRGMRIAVPVQDAEIGSPVNLALAVERLAGDWDPLDAQVWLDSEESSFYWTQEEASPQFWPSPGMTSLELTFPARDEAGGVCALKAGFYFRQRHCLNRSAVSSRNEGRSLCHCRRRSPG
jgi:hypothetical protein